MSFDPTPDDPGQQTLAVAGTLLWTASVGEENLTTSY